jgi:hypothetical protein
MTPVGDIAPLTAFADGKKHARNRSGELKAFMSACSHRGAMLSRYERAKKGNIHLPVPWLDRQQSGKRLNVRDPEGAGYPETFNKNGSCRASRTTAVSWRREVIAITCPTALSQATDIHVCNRPASWTKGRGSKTWTQR